MIFVTGGSGFIRSNFILDWQDRCSVIRQIPAAGKIGETYNIGGWNEKTHLEVVHTLCTILDELSPRTNWQSYKITFVADHLGHDRRYAIDATKLERELGWRPTETFETGIKKTVQWSLDNQDWVNKQYGEPV